MMPRRALLIGVLALVPVGVLAGCGGGSGSTNAADAGPSPSAQDEGLTPVKDGAIRIATKDYKYTPQMTFVRKGQKIVWKNALSTTHDVHAIRGATFASDVLRRGDTFEYTPKKAGLIDYECTLHPGMLGTIVVE